MATKQNKEVMAFDFLSDIGAGMEGTDKDSFAIPFLRIIQSNSPEVKRNQSQYLPDAAEGMLFNTVTKELYDGNEGVIILPCAYQRRFIVWAPKGGGSSYKGEMLAEEADAKINSGEYTLHNNRLYICKEGETPNPAVHDQVVDTRNHYCLILTPNGGATQALLSLSSSQIKKSKQLMGLLSGVKVETENGAQTPPTWMSQIRVTTVAESNDAGSWMGINFRASGIIQDASLYAQGKALNEIILSGTGKTKYDPKTEKF